MKTQKPPSTILTKINRSCASFGTKRLRNGLKRVCFCCWMDSCMQMKMLMTPNNHWSALICSPAVCSSCPPRLWQSVKASSPRPIDPYQPHQRLPGLWWGQRDRSWWRSRSCDSPRQMRRGGGAEGWRDGKVGGGACFYTVKFKFCPPVWELEAQKHLKLLR